MGVVWGLVVWLFSGIFLGRWGCPGVPPRGRVGGSGCLFNVPVCRDLVTPGWLARVKLQNVCLFGVSLGDVFCLGDGAFPDSDVVGIASWDSVVIESWPP